MISNVKTGIKIVCVAFIVSGCVTSNSTGKGSSSVNTPEKARTQNTSHWITQPGQGGLTIIGVSGRQFKQETEIEIAREDAAKKAAMYHGIYATYESIQNVGGGFLDYYIESSSTVEYDQEIEKYQDKLSFNPERDIFDDEGVLFVRFTYPVAFPEKITYFSGKNPDGKPEWTTRPPKTIGGFNVGVGFSGRQLRLSDTIIKSYEAAVIALVSRSSTAITTGAILAGNYSATAIHRQSAGNLKNFAVIEMWIDPASKAVWTLAVAQISD
jgi:hypothetical protein